MSRSTATPLYGRCARRTSERPSTTRSSTGISLYRERFGYTAGLCPAAETIEVRLRTLPLFPAMTDSDQDDVLRALDKVLAHYAR